MTVKAIQYQMKTAMKTWTARKVLITFSVVRKVFRKAGSQWKLNADVKRFIDLSEVWRFINTILIQYLCFKTNGSMTVSLRDTELHALKLHDIGDWICQGFPWFLAILSAISFWYLHLRVFVKITCHVNSPPLHVVCMGMGVLYEREENPPQQQHVFVFNLGVTPLLCHTASS